MDAETFLNSIMPNREKIDRFLAPPVDDAPGSEAYAYDAEIGWVQKDHCKNNGVEGIRTFASFTPDGARRSAVDPGAPCRIHTYGNSFTHCDQVSDGETWQEYLGAHLGERLANYGVGGHSVYQAYRRLLAVQAVNPCQYIVLNIWTDDHFRNLDSWRSIRARGRTSCGWTLPHLRVDPDSGRVTERDNLCQPAEALGQLADPSFVLDNFADDPVLEAVLAGIDEEEGAGSPLAGRAPSHGLPASPNGRDGNRLATLRERHQQAAFLASQWVVNATQRYIEANGKKLLVILSYGSGDVAAALEGRDRWDRDWVEWLKRRPYPVVDLLEAYVEDAGDWRLDVGAYCRRHFVGHCSPAGNFFTAQALRQPLAAWLDPKPPSHAHL